MKATAFYLLMTIIGMGTEFNSDRMSPEERVLDDPPDSIVPRDYFWRKPKLSKYSWRKPK